MSEMTSTPTPEDNSFSLEVMLNKKKFELSLNVKENSFEIKFSEKCSNKLVQTCYKESYSYDSLLTLHKFFSMYENISEVFYAIKTAITTGLYKLEKGEKEILLIITCLGKEIKMNIHEKPKIIDEMIITISNGLFELKEKFLNKLTELNEINQSFFEIKKQNKELIQQNNYLKENNEKLIKENKEFQKIIKNLKETGIEMLNTKIETILNNTLMTKQEKFYERIFRDLETKLRGDLLNENTIAFDNLSKAYLCNWLLNNNKNNRNKRISTVLLYKGTRDGDKAETFHKKCNNKGATLTLIKSTTNFHFGGFTPTPWEGGGGNYRSDSDSFLFSLDKKLKYPLKNSTYAVYDNSSNGPTFGGGHDMYIHDGCMNNESSYSNTGGSYDITDSFSGSRNFKVSEIEVFQIIFQ